MTASGWLQLGIYVALLLAITKPLGLYLWRVLDPARAGGKTFLDPVLGPVERLIYRILRVDPAKEHNWKHYAVAMLIFSVVTAVFSYGLMRLQDKIRGQRIARQRETNGAGWVSHIFRSGKKVEDELPVPYQSGCVAVEETQPVFDHQKVKEKGKVS